MTGKKILFLVNVDWFYISHRLPIALAAMKAGYNVHLACMFTDKAVYLSSLGIELHPLPLTRCGTGLRKELRCFLAISRLIRGLEPDIVHCITIKPVLYGGIASRLSCVRGRGGIYFRSGVYACGPWVQDECVAIFSFIFI